MAQKWEKPAAGLLIQASDLLHVFSQLIDSATGQSVSVMLRAKMGLTLTKPSSSFSQNIT